MPLLDPEFLELTHGLDVEAFWAENELCSIRSTTKPRCGLSFSPDDHWLFEFLDVPSTLRYYCDKSYRDELHRQANALLREYVGREYFEEDTWETAPRRIEELFGCVFAYHEGSTPWLQPVTDSALEFSHMLDAVERVNLRDWALPGDFRAEWERRKDAGLPLPALGEGSRGPATVMTSVLRPETFFYWSVDHPALLRRFRDLLAEKMVELNCVLRDFSGNNTPGWQIADDNCALFNARLYREICFPVLKRVLDALAPAVTRLDEHPDAFTGGLPRRYQHSDSSMGHLLGMQYELGIRYVNYGPEVDVGLIREKMPDAVIYGQLPPMLLRNGTPEAIRRRVSEDFHKAGTGGLLEVTTAGSLSAGTGLGRMRWLMQVVEQDCRYDIFTKP